MTSIWNEVVVEVPRDDAEAFADACLDAGALSVQAEDADADSPDEQPLFGEPIAADAAETAPAASVGPAFGWHRTRIAVLVDATTDPGPVIAAAAAGIGRSAPRVVASRRIADRDWVRETQAQFEPIPVGRRLIVVPSWHRDAVAARDDGRVDLIIDPGLAFGTGSHPTTRMCLEWLDEADLAGRRVIDYGCGSGILAIAAARLGAVESIGIDIDPQALQSAAENARVNRVALDVRSSSEALPAPADIVIANILSSPLKLLAPMLGALVAPDGYLVLSGVLERQIAEVADCYDPALNVRSWRTCDGWACLVGRR